MTVTEFLKTLVPFLSGITDEQAQFLAKAVEQITYNTGHTVIFRGSTVDGLHVLASGQVSVQAKVGKEVHQVASLGPGDVFGEISIIEGVVAGATIKAAEDGTLIFMIPQEAFLKVLRSDPALEARVKAVIDERKKSLEATKGPKKA